MIDKIIFPGFNVYMFRLIFDWTNQAHVKIVLEKLKEFFPHYAVSNENGGKTDQPHFQGVVWSNGDAKIHYNNLRSHFQSKIKTGKGHFALADAKNIKSLSKYCNNKEKKGIYLHNIPDPSVLGKWITKEDRKLTLKKALYDKFKSLISDDPTQYTNQDPYSLIKITLMVYVGFRPPPLSTILYTAYHAKYISEEIFINEYYKINTHQMMMYNTIIDDKSQKDPLWWKKT